MRDPCSLPPRFAATLLEIRPDVEAQFAAEVRELQEVQAMVADLGARHGAGEVEGIQVRLQRLVDRVIEAQAALRQLTDVLQRAVAPSECRDG